MLHNPRVRFILYTLRCSIHYIAKLIFHFFQSLSSFLYLELIFGTPVLRCARLLLMRHDSVFSRCPYVDSATISINKLQLSTILQLPMTLLLLGLQLAKCLVVQVFMYDIGLELRLVLGPSSRPFIS